MVTDYITFGTLHNRKHLSKCLSEEEVCDILDDTKYTYYRPEDLNKIVGVEIEKEL